VASRSAARGAQFAADWEIPRVFPSYEALLADPSIDAVYVPLPNSLHAEWSMRAARAGKHVLCEKPLALSVAEVDAIAAAAAEAGVHVAEAFMYRHHLQTHLVRRLVAEGAVGALRLIRGCFSFTLAREGDVRFDPALGGGCLLDVGCYPTSYARAISAAEPFAVAGAAVIGPTGVDLSFAAILHFPDAFLAMTDCSFISPFRTDIEIVGSEGTLRVPHPFKPREVDSVTLARGDRIEEIQVESPELYVSQVEDFARAAAGEAAPIVGLDDSRRNTAMLVALAESARTGRTVRL
jgi:predicted dehydrogenase